MSKFSAKFFSHVQGTAFYRDLHDRAVRLLPKGNGAAWFDVGCGPGLVARLAAGHGYQTTGFDIDPAMIEQARMVATHPSSRYEVAGIEELQTSGRKASVVSAASLLIVLNDRQDALHKLMSCLNDDGALLLIETTDAMKPQAAWKWLMKNGLRKRNWILLLWAWTRTHGMAVNPATLHPHGYRIEHADVFEGLVSAWLIRRNTPIR